jgi:hypothetical protein
MSEPMSDAALVKSLRAWKAQYRGDGDESAIPLAAQAAATIEDLTARLAKAEAERDAAVAKLAYLEAEARRFADMYSPASDGRNTFVIFADKIAAVERGDHITEAKP